MVLKEKRPQERVLETVEEMFGSIEAIHYDVMKIRGDDVAASVEAEELIDEAKKKMEEVERAIKGFLGR